MNDEQIKAAMSVKRAFKKCAKANLQGAVFEGNFCVWPVGVVNSDLFF